MGRFLLFFILLVGCRDIEETSPALQKSDSVRPDQEAWNVTKEVTRNGRHRVSIKAPYLSKYDRERISRMDGGVSVTFFGFSVSDTVSELTSRKAEIDEGRRILTAIENVVLVSNRGSTLYTDTLRWEEETEMIQGPARVRIEGDRGTETGFGFEAKSDLSTWTLRQVVTWIDTSSN